MVQRHKRWHAKAALNMRASNIPVLPSVVSTYPWTRRPSRQMKTIEMTMYAESCSTEVICHAMPCNAISCKMKKLALCLAARPALVLNSFVFHSAVATS